MRFECVAFDDAPFRKSKDARANFSASRKAEKHFAAKLRSIARHIADMLRTVYDGTLYSVYMIEKWSAHYAETLDAWARAVVYKMHSQVAIHEWRQWERLSREISAGLKDEVASAPIGEIFKTLMDDQVKLIKSMPTEAARRVHEITIKAMTEGVRHEDLVSQVMRIGGVTRSRATLIARTETARTASVLTQARAEYAGSVAYTWETAKDEQVRPSHRAMQGKVVMWDDPPVTDGLRYHAGQGPNCRCYPRPLFWGVK